MRASTVSLPPSPEPPRGLPLLRDYLLRFVQAMGVARLAGVVGLLLGATALEAGAWLLLAELLRQVAAPRPLVLAAVLPPLAAFCGLTVARILAQRAREISLLRLRLDYLNTLRNRLYATITSAPWATIAGIRHANVLSVLTSDLDRINGGTLALLQGLVTAGIGLVTVGVAIYVSPALALPALAAGGLLSLLLLGQTRRTLHLGTRLTEAHRAFVSNATDFLSVLKLVKAQGGEASLLQRFEQAGRGLDAEQVAFTRYQTGRRSLLELGGLVLVASLLLYATVGLQLALPSLLLALYLLSRLVPLVNQGATFAQMVTHMLPAWAALRALEHRLMAAPAPIALTAAADGAPIVLRQGVEMHNVVLHYQDSDQPALQGVTLRIPAQSTVALVGPSGAGKTSIADLVLGLLQPGSGRVAIDGAPLDERLRARWQQAIAYVPQETLLLPTSVRHNLVWDNAPHDEAALWEALRLALADGFVRRLPQGLDTVLGENGSGLSGGERQRLMLARAFLRQPQLLVLDEATSHLDAESEQAIREALRQVAGRMTILLIAHRLSTVREADQIVLIEQGRVLGAGTWDTLFATQPVFRNLVLADRMHGDPAISPPTAAA